MELSKLLNNKSIIGIVGSYKSTNIIKGKIKDLNINNISGSLKMVGLDDSYLEKDIDELTENELWKLELAFKLEKKVIVIGNMSKDLIFRDRENIKKLLLKLAKEYNKKVIIIDNNISSFFGLVEYIYVIKNEEILYETNNIYDDKLYEYTNIPKIIEFIKYVNNKGIKLNKTWEIYELIKDIYRSVE